MSDIEPGAIEEKPIPDTFQMDQSSEVLSGIRYEEVVAPRQELTSIEGNTKHSREFNEALKYSPGMRKDWTEPPEWTSGHTFGQALWNSVKRDNWIGNSGRWLDQKINETKRNDFDEGMIWDNQEALLYGISDEYHADILNAPTFGLARRESERVRSREMAIKREHNTHVGKTLVAEMAGFIIDPTNYLPGYGIIKGVALAKRTTSLGVLTSIGASSRTRQMAAFAALGGFEEAVRMAPRYASDPTFEANNYMEGIAMSAAFSGLLPVAFSGLKSGVGKLPAFNDDIQRHLHAWGVDVAVRQAMRFPGKLKEQGFRDPGTAAKKAKEQAQDAVSAKVKEFNKGAETKRFREAVNEDLKGDAPSNNKIMVWANRQLDQANDVAQTRVLRQLKRAGIHAGITAGALITTGPVGALATATLLANKDYLVIAAKQAVRARNRRRVAYDAAISAGDEKAAAAILRSAKEKPTVAQTVDEIGASIQESIDVAKTKLRDINEKARVCT